MQAIRRGEWADAHEKIRNPGKHFYLELAKKTIANKNRQRDGNGVSYTRKSMIICEQAKNVNVVWEELQLTRQL